MKIAFCLSAFLLPCFWAIPKIQSQSILGIEAGYGFPWAGDEISEGSVMFTGGAKFRNRSNQLVLWSRKKLLNIV